MVKPIWKCQVKDCDYIAGGTLEGFNEIVGHQLHHSLRGVPKDKRGFRLIDQDTGGLLARTLKKAREKGFLEPEAPPERAPEEVKKTPTSPEKTADSAYQQGYDKGLDDGKDGVVEAIMKMEFTPRCPKCGFTFGIHIKLEEKD